MDKRSSDRNGPSDDNSGFVTVKTTYVSEHFGLDPREVSRTWVRTKEEHLQTQKKQQQKKIERLDEKLLTNARGRREEPKKPSIAEKQKEGQLSLIDDEFLRLTDLLVPQIILPTVKTVERRVEPDGKNVVTTVEKFYTGEGSIDDPKTTYTRTTTETFYEDTAEREENKANLEKIKEKEAEKAKEEEKPPQQPEQPQQQEAKEGAGGKDGELTTTGEGSGETSVVTTTKDLPHGGKEKTVTNTTVEKLPDGMKKTTTKTTRHVTYPDGFEESETKIVITTSSGDEEPPKEKFYRGK